MPNSIEAVFGRNITIVYNSINIKSLNLEEIKKFFSDENPAIIQIPDNVVIIAFPNKPVFIQIEHERLLVNFNFEENSLGDFPICEYTIKINKEIIDSGSKMDSFGFNYDFGIDLHEDANKKLIIQFANFENNYLKKNKEKLIAFYPTINMKFNEIEYSYIFNQQDSTKIKVHVNAFF